jgi:fucokinase
VLEDVAESSFTIGTVRPASFAEAALQGLDTVAAHAAPEIAGRAFSVQSELLWAMAGWGTVTNRAGPAHNAAWLPAFALLATSPLGSNDAPSVILARRGKAVEMLKALRQGWAMRAHQLGRAARHYERAAGIMTAQCVYTAPVSLPKELAPDAAVQSGAWVTSTAPARVDLAGGWSDTPPVTSEARIDGSIVNAISSEAKRPSPWLENVIASANRGGGLVVNVAVTIDDQRPLGCRARLSQESGTAQGPCLTIRTRSLRDKHSSSSSANDGAPGVVISSLSLSSLDELSDYNQPHAEGALVKCALLVMGFVTLPSPVNPHVPDLRTQLQESGFASAVEIETWSLLPHGSGLGGSSILATTVFSVLAKLTNKAYDHTSITHLVLKLEQMLTTGGGWQDQVGGLWPGVKVSSCAASLPLQVHVLPFSPSSETSVKGGVENLLNQHLFLVYTGKTRLAKNLLQRVLRQWALREHGVTQTVAALRSNAVKMSEALESCNIQAVGESLLAYWEQKKLMAPGAEPSAVTHLMKLLQPHVFGLSLGGAGGGGFLVGISKLPNDVAHLRDLISSDETLQKMEEKMSVHSCKVDMVGLNYS